MGFEVEWLAARARYDDDALDRVAVARVQEWAGCHPPDRPLVVVDFGTGTGAGLRRALKWVFPREVVGYGVDGDAGLLSHLAANLPSRAGVSVRPILGDVLEPLDGYGGPPDGTVDLVTGNAIADIVPLDRLAARAAALARPGGLVFFALTYDGETAFAPPLAALLDEWMVAAFHRHMGAGARAGREVAAHLRAAGLEILRDAPSDWAVSSTDGPDGQIVLARLIRYVVEAAWEDGRLPTTEIERWERVRLDGLADGTLSASVAHRDVLARKEKKGPARPVPPR